MLVYLTICGTRSQVQALEKAILEAGPDHIFRGVTPGGDEHAPWQIDLGSGPISGEKFLPGALTLISAVKTLLQSPPSDPIAAVIDAAAAAVGLEPITPAATMEMHTPPAPPTVPAPTVALLNKMTISPVPPADCECLAMTLETKQEGNAWFHGNGHHPKCQHYRPLEPAPAHGRGAPAVPEVPQVDCPCRHRPMPADAHESFQMGNGHAPACGHYRRVWRALED